MSDGSPEKSVGVGWLHGRSDIKELFLANNGLNDFKFTVSLFMQEINSGFIMATLNVYGLKEGKIERKTLDW